MCRKLCAVRLLEEGKHIANKFIKAVIMNIKVENSKRCNIATECKGFNTVSQRTEKTKKSYIPLFVMQLCSWKAYYMQGCGKTLVKS